jgi:mono/diheme cytochrome c family protein
MWRIFIGPAALLFAVGAQAQENVALKAGTGREIVEGYCGACHSLDYPRINAPFLDRRGWETEVNKMITA